MRTTEPSADQGSGRYRLLERLAIGGMAEVFLAQDLRNERLIVIKRILPYLAEHPELVEAFQREAKIAARISHPNVVRLYQLWDPLSQQQGVPFIAMEYVEGSTFRELLAAAEEAGKPLPVEAALDLLCQACAGAHAAHELEDGDGRPYGLVHRDITPHNLIVDDRGQVKLLDFGIAKATERMEPTRTGLLKGKISYMSPEQCRQEPLDRRSDVFSLGVLGYQLLTGAKPFQGNSELAVMQAIVTGEHAPLRSLRPDVPAEIAAAIERAMLPDPGRRFPTAEALSLALAPGRPSRASTIALVGELLGPTHRARRRAVERALGRAHDDSVSGHPPVTVTLDQTDPVPISPRPHRKGLGVRGALGLGALALGALALLGSWGAAVLGQGSPVEAVQEDARTNLPSSGVTPAPVVMVLAPTPSSEGLLDEFAPLGAYLERRLQRPVLLQVASSYQAAAAQVAEGRAALGVLPSQTAQRTRVSAPDVQILAVQVVDGSTTEDGYLLVRRDAPIGSLRDLKGKTVCWTDEWSATGYLLPRRTLSSAGLDVTRDLASHFSRTHAQVLTDLLAGVCDVGATFNLNFNAAEKRGVPTARLKILALTGTSYHDVVVSGPAADAQTIERARDALIAFDPARDAGLSHLGAASRISGFEAPPPGLLSLPKLEEGSIPAEPGQ